MTEEKYTWEVVDHDQMFYENKEAIDWDDVVDLLNEQDQKIKELEQELFSERVGRFEDMLAEYGDLNDNDEWQEQFGMTRREAHKKAGRSDWKMIPEF